jgi:Protein of unknown function (DUF3662)/FHA domain
MIGTGTSIRWSEVNVGLLDNFEQRLDQLVNGAFARAFRDAVEPVEVAARIQRDMDLRAAIVSKGRTVVPNVFTVELSSADLERLGIYDAQLRQELCDMIRDYATEQRYAFLGPVEVSFAEDPTLETGMFNVRTQARAETRPRAAAGVPVAPGRVAGHPRLIIDAHSYPLTKSRTRIGRGSDVDIKIDDTGISRAHAEVVLGNPNVIRDLGSTNGTFVEGRRITEMPLYDGARIQLGRTQITFRDA